MSSKTTPADRRKVATILEAMRVELDTDAICIMLHQGIFAVQYQSSESEARLLEGVSLDDAFINALHDAAGTEPPPF
jgi:hypothetical protein